MIQLRDEMQNINQRLQTSASAKSFYHLLNKNPSIDNNHNEKLRKYFYKVLSFSNQYVKKYLVSEQYVFEMLAQNHFEDLLSSALKIICKLLNNEIKPQQQPQQIHFHNQKVQENQVDKIHKIIKDIVSPIQMNVIKQSQFYNTQLHHSNKSCQTFGTDVKNKHEKIKNLQNQLAFRQSSILSLIQQDSPCINSPKFNHHQLENSFDKFSINKDSKELERTYEKQEKDQVLEVKSFSSIIDNKNMSSSKVSNTSFADTTPNKNLMETKRKSKQIHIIENNKRFPKREIPKTMLSVDFISKKRRTPEKKRDFDIISNE